MENIIIEKIEPDLDSSMIGIKVTVVKQNGFSGKFSIYGNISRMNLQDIALSLAEFTLNPIEIYDFELIDSKLGSDSSVIIKLLQPDLKGYITVLIDAEVQLNQNKKESYSLQIQSEWGKVENFGKKLKSFAEQDGLFEVQLN